MIAVTNASIPLDPAVAAAELVEVRGVGGAQRYAIAICAELGIESPPQLDVEVVVRLAAVPSLAGRIGEFDDPAPILREIETAVADVLRHLLGDDA